MCTNQSLANSNAKYSGTLNHVVIRTTTDAGHGDMDPKSKKKIFDTGAVDDGIDGMGNKKSDYEKDYALKVDEWIDYWLYIYGIDNQRTRYDDYTLMCNERRVQWRYEKAKKNKSNVFVSIHLDSGAKDGFYIIYNKPTIGVYNDNASLCRLEESKKLGKIIAKNMKVLNPRATRDEDVIVDDETAAGKSLGVLREFKGTAAVLIELCGIESLPSKRLISESSNDIGKSIATGIYKYLFGENEEPSERRRNILYENNTDWELKKRCDDCDVALTISENKVTVDNKTTQQADLDKIRLVRSKILLEPENCYRLVFEAHIGYDEPLTTEKSMVNEDPIVVEAVVEEFPYKSKWYALAETKINLRTTWDRYEMVFSVSGDSAIKAQLVLNLGMLPMSTKVGIRNLRLFSNHDNVAYQEAPLPEIGVNGRILSVSSSSKTDKRRIRVANLQGKVIKVFDVTGSEEFSLKENNFPAGTYIVEIIGMRGRSTQIKLN